MHDDEVVEESIAYWYLETAVALSSGDPDDSLFEIDLLPRHLTDILKSESRLCQHQRHVVRNTTPLL